MTERSNVTLEPFPTLEEAIKVMLESFMDAQGYADFWDSMKVIYSSKHEDVAKELISQMEDMSDKAMIKEGLCPDCGSELRFRRELSRFDCTNSACALSYSKEVC